MNRTLDRLLPAMTLVAVLFATCPGCALNPDDGGAGATGGTGGTTSGGDATGGSSNTSSGIARVTALADLTTDQASVLCDWTNLKQGGYGRVVACPERAEATSPNNLACVNTTPTLGARCMDLNVGDVEDCANATGADLCKLETAPACIAVTTCGQ